jgi:thiol:disulfide interchange protein
LKPSVALFSRRFEQSVDDVGIGLRGATQSLMSVYRTVFSRRMTSMVHVALALLLAFAGDIPDKKVLDYEAAFAKADQEKKPLVILVGAKWCASCQVMKRDTIEPMAACGELDGVVVTYIDKDERPELAGQLMKGETLPQVVMFAKEDKSWKRYSLTGMQSRNRMVELLGKVAAVAPNRLLR